MIHVTNLSRRRLLTAGLGLVAGAAAPALAACTDPGSLAAPTSTGSAPDDVAPTSTSTPRSPAELVEAETPYLTPQKSFFRIDTSEGTPNVSIDEWELRIHGMVDKPLTLRYADLASFTPTEQTVTLACVSNEVGGELVGNAVWKGVLLSDLLREAGAQSNAEQVFTTSADGWTCGFPLDAALDGRGALLATSMNGGPLTAEHGFPARLVVPGLYGYVSATKWVTDIELTTWEAQRGYWTTRGWSTLAPIKAQSRIDVPRRGIGLDAGTIALGGVAWAPRAGVQRVEVRVDDGAWTAAELDDRSTVDTWRQWYYLWDAVPGEYRISVRVIDGNGTAQTEEEARPDPDGATGLHTRRFTVR